jgi:hypothetical protein
MASGVNCDFSLPLTFKSHKLLKEVLLQKGTGKLSPVVENYD